MTTPLYKHYFQGLFQMGYVTNDIEQAIERFSSQYGVNRFLTLPEPISGDVYSGGKPVTNVLRLAFANVNNNQIELIQPIDDGSRRYSEVLTGAGFELVFHHVACRLYSEGEWQSFRRSLDETRHPIAIENISGPTSYVYLDERKTLGHYVEYMWLDPEGEAMFAAIPDNG